jgi:transcriptional regulator with PAS, ATPase and Fis domain
VGDVPLDLALDNIEFGTLVVDAEGIVTFYSKSYERFLGIPRAQVLGRHVADVIENTRMHLVVQSGEPEIGWKHKIKGQNMVVQYGLSMLMSTDNNTDSCSAQREPYLFLFGSVERKRGAKAQEVASGFVQAASVTA